MDERLLRATYEGDLPALHHLLQKNPFLLSDTAFITSHENILNVAIKSQRPQISVEIAKHGAHLLTLQDRDGMRPLDVASAYGSVEIVHDLLALTSNPSRICQMPGRDGKSAIHHACINGRVEIIEELLKACPECVKDVTSFGETVVHLAIKYYRLDALKCLLEWVEKLGVVNDVINSKDKDGNTVLHYAASGKLVQSIELLLATNSSIKNSIEVEAKNFRGLTPMDIVNIYTETSTDVRLKQLLQNSQGSRLRSATTPSPAESTANHHHQYRYQLKKPENFKELIEFFKFNWERESASEMRNAMLVVAALFVSVAAQGLFNLPDHLFPDKQSPKQSPEKIYSQIFYLASNYGLLSSALTLIDYLTADMPFSRENVLAGLCIWGASSSSVWGTHLPWQAQSIIIFVVPLLPSILRQIPGLLLGRMKTGRANNNGNTNDDQQASLP